VLAKSTRPEITSRSRLCRAVATDIRDFPPGGYTADGGPNPQRGVWQQIVGRSPITGPALLRAAQASQASPGANPNAEGQQKINSW